ncbi:MAG: hypothetical protein KAJ56_01735 [Candidatus Aenigmarchaeota archaeon]|nr:hypothetical protein [Candidatus Aenigmarchaeota archaeon]
MLRVDAFGYRQIFKQAKRLVSEGRQQLEAAENFALKADDYFDVCEYSRFEEKKEAAYQKKETGLSNIEEGLELYRSLLIYENIDHFNRIKTAMRYTLDEFDHCLSDTTIKRYYDALFIGPE